MTTITAHTLSFPEPVEELDFVRRELARAPAYIRQRPDNVGDMLTESLRQIGFCAALGRPDDELSAALRCARDLAVGLFRRGGARPAETVRFTVGDEVVEVPGGTSAFTTAIRWNAAFGVALVLRDAAALDALCAYDPGDFEGQYDRYHVTLAAALSAAHRGDASGFDAVVAEAEQAKMFPRWGALHGGPVARLARAVYRGEREAVDGLVVDALRGHAKLCSPKRESHRAEDYLPLTALGLVARARDAGMAVTVESAYLPPGLVAG